MAVFISYSHADADFVDQLAGHLIAGNARVWVDRWELHVGDSLRGRIEAALEQASAVIFVLSPAAVASDWCQRELSAALVRELEERRVIVLPVLAEECVVPLFLRDKMYADFRTNFDEGLQQVFDALARVTAENLGRLEEPDGNIDWGTRWIVNPDEVLARITLVQTPERNPYTVLTTIDAVLNDLSAERHRRLCEAGADSIARQLFFEVMSSLDDLESFNILVTDAEPVSRGIDAVDPDTGFGFRLTATCQRLGEDTGRDILVPVGALMADIATQTRDRLRPLEESDRAAVLEIMGDYID
jgi:TIR domain